MSAPSSSGVWPGMPWMRSRPTLATPAPRRRRKAVGRVRLRRAGPARRAAPARSSARRARRARREARPSPGPAARRRPRRVRVVDVLGVGLDGDLGVRREVRPEELEQPLEPVRPQQARRAAAEVQRAEAAHVVRRPLPLPLGGDAVHERVEPAGHLRPGPPAGHRVDGLRGELAVVALRPAERHVHVDVPHRAGERRAPRAPRHRVGTQKKKLPSRSSSSTPPLRSITRRDAALRHLAVDARRVDAELGGERQRRGQHGRGVASPPRRRPDLEADVAAVVQQVRRQPVTDREAAEVLVAGRPPEHRLRHVAVDPLAGQRRAVQPGEVEVGLARPLARRRSRPRSSARTRPGSLRGRLGRSRRWPPLVVVLAERSQRARNARRAARTPEVRARRRLGAAAGARHRPPSTQRSLSPGSSSSTARKASCGTSTTPSCFMRFLPSFCFSSSLRLRLMSPP